MKVDNLHVVPRRLTMFSNVNLFPIPFHFLLLFSYLMRLVIKENYDFLCDYVANYVIDRINKFNPTPERPFVLGFCRFVGVI